MSWEHFSDRSWHARLDGRPVAVVVQVRRYHWALVDFPVEGTAATAAEAQSAALTAWMRQSGRLAA